MQGLQGLQGLQGFLAAQGLHGLHGFFAAQGLQGLHGLQAFAAQGLQAPQVLGAHGLSEVAIWIEVPAALDTAVGKAMAPVARVATLSAITVFLIILRLQTKIRSRDIRPLSPWSPQDRL